MNKIIINGKLPKEQRDQLRFVVEDFLNYESDNELRSYLERHNRELEYFYQLNDIFFDNYYLNSFGIEEGLKQSDLSKKKISEIRFFLLEIHEYMRGVWNYINNLLDEREKLYKRIEYDINKTEETEIGKIFEKAYKNNKLDDLIEINKVINLKAPEPIENIEYELTFEDDKLCFKEIKGYRPDPIMCLINFFQEIPRDYFERCEFCEKWMVKTSKGKHYCKRCVPKKYQKKKWQNMSEEEKRNYNSKRKVAS